MPHGITVAALAVFIVLGLACASELPSRLPVSSRTYEEMGHDTFSQFRFFISGDVTLTKVEYDVSADARATVLTTNIQRNVINLQSRTPGRVQGTPSTERLEIGFEKLPDGTIPTFSFVQKKENDLYYFEKDSSDYITYAGEFYTIEYEGEEPHLLYESLVRETTSTRNMGGLN